MIGYIIKAIESGQPLLVKMLLCLFPKYISWASEETGETLLHLASRALFITKSVKIIKYLVSCGADVNALAYDGSTPTFILSKYSEHTEGRSEAISFFIDHGAQVDINSAILLCDVALAKRIIEETPSEINRLDAHGDSPLVNSLIRRPACNDIFNLLIERGAYVDPFSAIYFKSLEYFRELVSDESSVIKLRRDSGESLFSKAVILGKYDLARFFLEKGASVEEECRLFPEFIDFIECTRNPQQVFEELGITYPSKSKTPTN